MALTLTDRLELPQWGQGSDGPSRVQFNDAFKKINDRAAYDDGAAGGSALPTAGVVTGRYAQTVDTVHRRLFRRTGSGWQQVGGTSWAETTYARADGGLPTSGAARIARTGRSTSTGLTCFTARRGRSVQQHYSYFTASRVRATCFAS